MLPRIDPQERYIPPHNRILILIRLDFEAARLAVFDEPCPAAALDAGEGGVELGAEGGEAAVGFEDGFLKCTSLGRFTTSSRILRC